MDTKVVILSLPLEQGSALQKITNEVPKILPSSQPSLTTASICTFNMLN